MIRITRKSEIIYIVSRLAAVFVIVLAICWSHRPKKDAGFKEKKMSLSEFRNDRQMLWINRDSLMTIITPLEKAEPGIFSWKSDNSKAEFTGVNKKRFERIFLSGEPLANWTDDLPENFTIGKDGMGFSAPVKLIGKEYYVCLPAEIIQSLQLAN